MLWTGPNLNVMSDKTVLWGSVPFPYGNKVIGPLEFCGDIAYFVTCEIKFLRIYKSSRAISRHRKVSKRTVFPIFGFLNRFSSSRDNHGGPGKILG